MDIFSAGALRGKFNIPAPTQQTIKPINTSESVAQETQSGVNVAISAEGREKQEAADSLRFDGSVLNSTKTEKKQLSPEEKLDQRIAEVKEKIQELQQEIQALTSSNSEQAKDKIEMLNLQMQALLGELNSLMEQKLESTKQGKG